MLRLSFNGDAQQQPPPNAGGEIRVQAMNNLLVLCRDSSDGASRVWQNGQILAQLLSVVQDCQRHSDADALCALRIMDELAKLRDRVFILLFNCYYLCIMARERLG